jgi:hypothetical protein
MKFPHSVWTDKELDESILKLCDEFPDARMAACSRALEHCRRTVPFGTSESLLTAMRGSLLLESEVQRAAWVKAA